MSDSTLASSDIKNQPARNDSPSNSEASTKRNKKNLLIFAIVLAVAWWLVLIWLATFQANQPILNRIQISQSTDIVTAKITDVSKGTIEVEKSLRGTLEKGQTISILNLSKTNVKKDDLCLLPLLQFQKDQWDITPFRSPKTGDRVFIIYPATEKILTELNPLLENQQ